MEELITRIDAEIAKLQAAKQALLGLPASVTTPVQAKEPAETKEPVAEPSTKCNKACAAKNVVDTKARLEDIKRRIDQLSYQEKLSRIPEGFVLYSASSPLNFVEPGDPVYVERNNAPGVNKRSIFTRCG